MAALDSIVLTSPPPVPPTSAAVPGPLPVVTVPVNIPAPVIHEVSSGPGWWITAVVALTVAVATAYLSRGREHQKWLWERRVDLYLKVRAGIRDDEAMWRSGDLAVSQRLPERLGHGLLDEVVTVGSPYVYERANDYFLADRHAFELASHETAEKTPDSVRSEQSESLRAARSEAERLRDLLVSEMLREVHQPPGLFAITRWQRSRARSRSSLARGQRAHV